MRNLVYIAMHVLYYIDNSINIALSKIKRAMLEEIKLTHDHLGRVKTENSYYFCRSQNSLASQNFFVKTT